MKNNNTTELKINVPESENLKYVMFSLIIHQSNSDKVLVSLD